MLTVYGIKTCDTVRRARKWLEARTVPYTFIDLRESPPSSDEVNRWVGALGASAMCNTSGRSYRALPADRKTWPDEQWITAFADDPMLLKRPLIVRDGEALLAGFRGTDDDLCQALGL